MYLILISLIFSISSSVFGKEVDVHIDNLKYKISFDKDSVAYSGASVDLSLKKAKCNQHLIAKFNLLMDKMLSEELSTTDMKDSFKLTIDKKVFFESKQTVRAAFFKDFDRLFKQIKTEEFVNCQKQ